MNPTLATFTGIDWAVLVGYMAFVSVLGVWLAGKQKDMQDFFRGGDKLPWYAVSASLIATTISAVTFVGVPAVAFAGDMTYLQLGVIAGLISRVFITFVLVPAYYEKRVYSPYDYMGDKLGGGAKGVTTALFTLGGLLAQSARVYLTALVLTLVMADQLAWVEDAVGLSPLATSIILIGIIAVAWTMLGGIATVVWTDALLFLVFVTGGVAALWVILSELPGGWSQFVEVGSAAEKFTVFNIDQAFSLVEPYTLAAAGFAVVVGNIGVYGTDQLLAQRIFCCKDRRNAQYAMMSSYLAELVTTLMLLVGVGLFVFYTAFPERLSGAFAARVAEENDKIFPAFILEQMPVGVTGLVIAGIFAAAISSLTSILAALAQTTISSVYLPARARKLGVDEATEEALAEHDPREGKRIVNVSRAWIVFWGVALCLAAFVVDAFKDATGVPILDLALALASYIVGGLFAAFLLAWLPVNVNGRGLVWAAPLGVLAVFACRFHEDWALVACGVGVAALVVMWVARALAAEATGPGVRTKRLWNTGWLVLGAAGVMAIQQFGYFHAYDGENVVMVYPDMVDDAGERVLDPEAEPVMLTHPITDEALLGEDGRPLRASDAKQVALKDLEAGEPKKVSIAWPWYAPIGGGFALLFGWLLADRRDPVGGRVEAPASSPRPALSAAASAEGEA
ncbi:MAG: hypothetical protein AAGE65_03770 [Planctomycetota bacterium]